MSFRQVVRPKTNAIFLCLRPFRAPQNGLPNALYLQPVYEAADAQAPFGDAPDFSVENRINPCAAQKSIVREKKEKIFFSEGKTAEPSLSPPPHSGRRMLIISNGRHSEPSLPPTPLCGGGEGKPGCRSKGQGSHTGRPLRRGLSAALASAKKGKCFPRTYDGAAGLLRASRPAFRLALCQMPPHRLCPLSLRQAVESWGGRRFGN